MTMLRALAALVALWPAVTCAQAERVTIRLAPAPGQRLHTRMAGEGHLVVEDEHRPTPPSPPFNLHLATTIGLTRVVANEGAERRVDARVTVDDIKIDVTMNRGSTTSEPTVLTPLLGQLAGQQATMIYDADGRIRQLDTAGPSNIVLDDSLKVLVGSVFGINGTLTLAVGESVTRPVDAAVPLIEYRDSRWTGDMRFTLNGISQEGAAQIAHMTTALSGGLTLVHNAPTPLGTLRLKGDGTLDVDLKRGVITAAEQRVTLDGLLEYGLSGERLHAHGTMTMSQTTR